jgi:hypothetical protein
MLGIALAAIVLSGGTLAYGRHQSGLSLIPWQSTPSGPVKEFHGSTLLASNGTDVDPKPATAGLADIAFNSKAGGTVLLNNSQVAPVSAPTTAITEEFCRNAADWSSAPIGVDVTKSAA